MSQLQLNKAYSWAIQTCNDANVRYSQTYRYQQTVNGLTYYDCSSFIWYALKAGGYDLEGVGSTIAFTTSNMGDVLTALGFKYYASEDGSWLAGDIVWRSGHTEMVYLPTDAGGYTMGAHTNTYAAARQVSINTSETLLSAYTYVYYDPDNTGATSYGYSAYVVAAICGNFWQESGINPGIWESLSEGTWTDLLKGYGLGQWTNTGNDTAGRLYQLHEFLSTNGYTDDDGDGQLEFLLYEGTWYTNSDYGYSTLDEFLNSSSTDLEELTHAYNICWEGIHDSSWDERVTYAQKCYNYIIAHANDTSITTWYTGNTYLSESERLNNAVLVYRHLSAGGGGGGTYTVGKKKKNKATLLYRRPNYRIIG